VKSIFWIASYPRSGNTWLRFILSSLLFDFADASPKSKWGMAELVPDFGPGRAGLLALQATPEAEFVGGSVALLKTHHAAPYTYRNRLRLPASRTVGFVYIYRHPLDVLVSALNYAHYKNKTTFFRDGNVKTPDELYRDGETDAYVESFMQQDTAIPMWMPMSGTWRAHVEAWLGLQQRYPDTAIALSYDRMTDDPVAEVMKLARAFPQVTEAKVTTALEFAERATTQNSGGKSQFFWKRKSGNYLDYFSDSAIAAFEAHYADTLARLQAV